MSAKEHGSENAYEQPKQGEVKPLGFIHFNTCGTMEEESLGVTGFCLHARSKSKQALFAGFIAKAERQLDIKVKFVRHDGAKDLKTNLVVDFYNEHGIHVQSTVPYANQTNGTAERKTKLLGQLVAAYFTALDWTRSSGLKQP